PLGRVPLRVGVVDPLGFRPLALTPARDASYVWTALLGGEAVVSYDAAHLLKISDSEPIRFGKMDPVAVGAFADTGVPNVADVLISRQTAASGSFQGRTRILEIGARPGAPVDRIGRALRRLIPGVELHRLVAKPPAILQPSDPQPVGVAQGSIIGTMHYLIQKNGFIKPDPAWVNAYIVEASVPILGTVTCNRLMVPQLAAALSEIARDGLTSAVDPQDYGGCYVPRFVDRNPALPLSMHAFGLAIDLNVSENQLGTEGHMDPRVVQIFEKWGFRWGGTFSTRPDPMHFELARLVSP
ncbi:MAG: M15 family metallopeptidase, partial [Actinomycetota bacterium]|nr:M15 family metallopeptidase [Actinomycetota bacterium]